MSKVPNKNNQKPPTPKKLLEKPPSNEKISDPKQKSQPPAKQNSKDQIKVQEKQNEKPIEIEQKGKEGGKNEKPPKNKETNEKEGKSDENKSEHNENKEEEKENIEDILKKIELTEKDEKFLKVLNEKMQKLDEKINTFNSKIDESSEQDRVTQKQQKVNENLEKLIQQVRESDYEHLSLDKQKDVKKSIENTIIEVFSQNQKLEELVEDMKKGFNLKNRQIFTLQEELNRYQTVCKEQEKQIEYLESRLAGKEKVLNQFQEDPKKKLAQINEKLREMQIETTGAKPPNFKENFENPNNSDPYDIWKTSEDDLNNNANNKSSNGKSQKLEDILGNKNNLWILKHENELSQVNNNGRTYKR